MQVISYPLWQVIILWSKTCGMPKIIFKERMEGRKGIAILTKQRCYTPRKC